MRRAAKIDANQTEIVEAFRRLGCSVLDLSRVGQGCPDLLICGPVGTMLVEVKTAKGRATRDQVTFWRQWKGQIAVVRSVDDVMSVMWGL